MFTDVPLSYPACNSLTAVRSISFGFLSLVSRVRATVFVTCRVPVEAQQDGREQKGSFICLDEESDLATAQCCSRLLTF